MKRVYINNAEYNLIFNSTGVDTDKLCSVFVYMRGSKNGKRRYNPIGKLKHYGLLKKETNLSRHAIEIYVPKLIELGLVTLNSDGGVSVVSTKRSFNLFKGDIKREKLIPIQMCQSYIKTSIQVGFVRIKNSITNQENQINIKEKQKKLIKKYTHLLKNPQKTILSKKEIKSCEKLIERYGSIDKFNNSYCSEVILSQNGFANLNKNIDGRYFKKQLLENNLIESKIRTEVLFRDMSYKKYLLVKTVIISQHGKGVFWCPKSRSVKKFLSSKLKQKTNQNSSLVVEKKQQGKV